MFKTLALLSLLLVAAQPVLADEIVFQNNERLLGTLVNLGSGTLTFQSDTLGEITVELSQIKTFRTDEPVELRLMDGTVLNSKTQLTDSGKILFDGTELIPAQQIDLDKIEAINPPAKPQPKWTGSAHAGITSTHGNTFDQSGSFGIDGTKREETRRTTFDALYVFSRTKDDTTGEKRTTEENVTVNAKRDYFLTEKWYSFINGRFKKDHIADLERRIIAGAGAGYQWVEKDDLKFNTDGGLAYRHEKYDTRIANPAAPPALIQEIETNDNISAQFGYNLFWQFCERSQFLHDMVYYPSLETVSDYFLTTSAELRYQHSKSIFSSVKTIFDYNSTPGEGTGSTDIKHILSLGWTY